MTDRCGSCQRFAPRGPADEDGFCWIGCRALRVNRSDECRRERFIPVSALQAGLSEFGAEGPAR